MERAMRPKTAHNTSKELGNGKEPPSDYGCSNNGFVEVYTDLDKGTETYKIGGSLVTQNILSPNESAMFDQFCPVNITGIKKIQIFDPPSPIRSISPDPIKMEEEDLSHTAEIAKDALAYFNNKHHTDYELVEPLHNNTYVFDCDGNWTHANFTAKPRAALDGENGDSCIKHFFAEEKYIFESDRSEVTACCILDGVETTTTCGICSDHGLIVHPTSGFRKGL